MQTIEAAQVLTGNSPLDNSPLPPVAITQPAEVAAIVAAAQAAQTEWATRPVVERARVLKRAGEHLMAHADELAAILHRELGKPLTDAYAVDLGSTPEVFRYYTRNARQLLASQRVRFSPVMFPGKRGRVDRLPHGLVALITPWNYPVSIPIHNIVPALLAGNAVVFKPSEYAARTGAKLIEILSSQLPPGLLGLVQGTGQTGETLIRSGVNCVVFVGGAIGGRAVAQTAADLLIPVTLELGGKDAAIVLEDADLDRAANGIAWAGMVNAGQSCAAVERVYVVKDIAEAFTAKMVEVAQSLRVGDDAANPGAFEIGPIANTRQLEIINHHIAEAQAAGAEILCGGVPDGQFYPPTVLTGVDGNMAIMQRETFGPVLPIQVVPDEATAIELANATPYGLTGSVWTRDLKRGVAVASQLNVGVATVNNHMFSGAAPQAVWSGRGMSGYGVQNSRLAIEALTRPRLLAVDANKVKRELWWFPYDKALVDLGRGMLAYTGKRHGTAKLSVSRHFADKLAAMFVMTRGVAIRSLKSKAPSPKSKK